MEKGIETLEAEITEDPTNSELSMALAKMLFVVGKTSEAIKCYDMSSGYTSIIAEKEEAEEVISYDNPIVVSVDTIGDSAASDGISEVD